MTERFPNRAKVKFSTEYAKWQGVVLSTFQKMDGMVCCVCETRRGEVFVVPQTQLEPDL